MGTQCEGDIETTYPSPLSTMTYSPHWLSLTHLPLFSHDKNNRFVWLRWQRFTSEDRHVIKYQTNRAGAQDGYSC